MEPRIVWQKIWDQLSADPSSPVCIREIMDGEIPHLFSFKKEGVTLWHIKIVLFMANTLK